MPTVPVALGQRDGGGRAPASRRVALGLQAPRCPAFDDAIHPLPGGLHLVAAHEAGGVALDDVQQQTLVGDRLALLGEGLGQAEVQRLGCQAVIVVTDAGHLVHDGQGDLLWLDHLHL